MREKTSVNEIRLTVINILEEVIQCESVIFTENMWDKDLLGSTIRLKARDLLKLYFEVKRIYNIELSEEDILNGEFRTVNKIVGLVTLALSQISTSEMNESVK